MADSWGSLDSFEGKEFNTLDPEFTKKVTKLIGGQDLTTCFQCSKCSAGCPVSDKVNIQIHEVMRMLLFGLKEVLDSDMVWLCTTCYQCQERCPQGIDITDILFGLKNMAFRKGIRPQGYASARQNLYDNGKLYAPTDWEREDLELDPVPEFDINDTKKLFDKNKLLSLEEEE
ncbi:4Fe-4S dicluster domain-containing protein [Candidatus Thorarchaeota archaeon]|nr:MAG: 4Fe-4S dicluster domain-containing protein [Candidatus Thorarchaeota archaeon]